MSTATPQIFKEFIHLFELHQTRAWNHPWDDSYRLTEEERRTVMPSIKQFQLGESSDGSEFINRAKTFSAKFGDLSYARAVESFIAEENRHSALLGRFMALERVAPLSHHWLDATFRMVRRLAGVGTMASTLVAAEIIARPYYRALRGATKSKLLKSICEQILAEEDTHIRFQAAALACVRLGHSIAGRSCAQLLHRGLLEMAISVVWREHRSVFRAGNYTFKELRAESLVGLAQLNQHINQYFRALESRLYPVLPSALPEMNSVESFLYGR